MTHFCQCLMTASVESMIVPLLFLDYIHRIDWDLSNVLHVEKLEAVRQLYALAARTVHSPGRDIVSSAPVQRKMARGLSLWLAGGDWVDGEI